MDQPPTICHTQENVRPFNQDYETEDGQPAGNLSICSETVELINEMNKESKDSQEKVRELIMFTCWPFVKLCLPTDWTRYSPFIWVCWINRWRYTE